MRVIKYLSQSDLIYLLTDQHRDHLIETKAAIGRIQDVLQPGDERMKVVVNRMAGIGWTGERGINGTESAPTARTLSAWCSAQAHAVGAPQSWPMTIALS